MQIEIRIKFIGITKDWDEIIPITIDLMGSDIEVYLQFYANVFAATSDGRIQEFRWNYPGSLQGHYWQPKEE